MRRSLILFAFVLISIPATIIFVAAALTTMIESGSMTIQRIVVVLSSLVALVMIGAAWREILADRTRRLRLR